MRKIKGWALVTLGLGALLIVSMLASHLALTDIWKGIEPNLSTEWGIVRAGFVFEVLFLLSVCMMIRRIFQLEHT
jgi:hypothetical protein